MAPVIRNCLERASAKAAGGWGEANVPNGPNVPNVPNVPLGGAAPNAEPAREPFPWELPAWVEAR